MHRIIFLLFLLFSSAISLVACVPTREIHGYILEKESLKQLKTGLSKKQVESIMGTPTLVSYVDERDWYYMWTKHELKTYHAPRLVDQFIISLSFNPQGRLQSVKFTDMNDTQPVAFSTQRTPIYGRQAGSFEQFLAGSIFGK